MKKAALLLFVLFVVNCAHRAPQPTVNTPAAPAFAIVQPDASAPPSVTSEPPSPLPVEAPAIVPPEQHEAAGRFLQRVAYRTRVRESMTTTPAKHVVSVPVETMAQAPPVTPQSSPSPQPKAKPSRRRQTLSTVSFLVCCAVIALGIFFERAKLV